VELYGLYVFTHGWAKILTVMSPDGAAAVFAHIEAGEDITAQGGAGRLPQYFEKRDGALQALVARYGIEVLEKADWDAKKAALSEAVWR
jgi:hypothetical protein